MTELEYANFIASFGCFNPTLQYNGEDLHILRNGLPFELSNFFNTNFSGFVSLIYNINTTTTNPAIITDSDATYIYIRNSTVFDNNIRLTKASGQVLASSLTINNSQHKVRNLIVDARFKINVDNSEQTFTVRIRLHFHDSVSSVWLTPSSLSLMNDTFAFTRFHIYALFDDGVIGDVSCDQQRLTWSVSNAFASVFEINAGGINGRVRLLNTTTIGLKSQCIQFAYSYFNSSTTAGSINVIPSLATGTNGLSLDCIHGPGANLRGVNANIAIISDGFTSNDAGYFNTLVDNFPTSVATANSLLPWNHLINDINVWKGFAATSGSSYASSGSIDCELVSVNHFNSLGQVINLALTPADFIGWADTYLAAGSTITFGASFYTYVNSFISSSPIQVFPIKYNGPTSISLSKLISLFGFPTKADINISRSNKITQWSSIYQPSGSNVSSQLNNDQLYNLWRLLAFRFLAEKEDTPFAVTLGVKPGIGEILTSTPQVQMDKYRMDRAYLNRIMANSNIINTTTNIGELWDKVNEVGKDANNIVLLSKIPYRTATSHFNREVGNYLALTGYMEERVIEFVENSSKYFINYVVEPAYRSSFHQTLLHELGHSMFNMADEYGGIGGPIDKFTTLLIKQSFDDVTPLLNTQLKRDIQDYLIVWQYNAAKIRWRWLRYSSALLVRNITGTGPFNVLVDSYDYLLQANFQIGDRIFLRQRNLTAVNQTNQIPDPLYSCEFEVTTVPDLLNNTVQIAKVDSGASFAPGSYFPGGLLVKTVQDPFAPTRHAELISKLVLDNFNSIPLPFNTSDDNDYSKSQKLIAIPPVLLNFNGNLVKLPYDISLLGGLYKNGYRLEDEGFHPFGFCEMRGTLAANAYCPVCRYILAERLNPHLHYLNDALYDKSYPRLFL